MQKRGISPLIATVLIIGFVIVLAALVIQWGGGLFEKIRAESDIESQKALACSRINLNIINAKTDFFNSKAEVSIESLSEQKINGFFIRLSGENGIDSIEAEDELKLGELKKINIPRFNIVKTGLVNSVEIFSEVLIENKSFVCENKIIKNVLNYDPSGREIESITKLWDDDVFSYSSMQIVSNESFSGNSSILVTSSGGCPYMIPLPIKNAIKISEKDYVIFAFKQKDGIYPGVDFYTSNDPSHPYYIGAFKCGSPGGRAGGWDINPDGGNKWKLTIADLKSPTKGNQLPCIPASLPGETLNSFKISVCNPKSGYFDSFYFYNTK